MLLVPLLQHRNGLASNLYIQLDIFGQAWVGEIRRPDESRRADNFQTSMGDVSLGVEFVLAINATGNLSRTDRFDNPRYIGEKAIFFFFAFKAQVEALLHLLQPRAEGVLRDRKSTRLNSSHLGISY